MAADTVCFFYGNYVENFGAPNLFATGINGQSLSAETAQQWEAGIKTEFFDGRLVLYQYDIAGFSELVSVHGKACLAGNSRSITNRHNAVHGH